MNAAGTEVTAPETPDTTTPGSRCPIPPIFTFDQGAVPLYANDNPDL